MTLNDKFEAALARLREHNEAVGEGNPGHVDCDKFIANLKSFGATSEDTLGRVKWQNILAILKASTTVEFPVDPEQLARDIVRAFRPKDVAPPSENKPFVGGKKAARMTIKQLVESFDPEESDNAVGQRLDKVAKHLPCWVPKHGRVVDVETTTQLVQEIKDGFGARPDNIIVVEGEIQQIYHIGELPDAFAAENPIYHGRPLRPLDETCDQLNRSWKGVGMEVRQFIYIGVEMGRMSTKQQKAHDLLDMAVLTAAMAHLKTRYVIVAAEFKKRQKKGSLPRLEIELKSPKQVRREKTQGEKAQGVQHGPFEDGRVVSWIVPPDAHSNFYRTNH